MGSSPVGRGAEAALAHPVGALADQLGNRRLSLLLQPRGALGGGEPLARSVRARMEAAFGTDFHGVRVHTGPEAARAAEALEARAFTVGSEVVFGAGRYRPGSLEGERLIAHELAHVVQQRSGPLEVARQEVTPGPASSPSEAQAQQAAATAVPAATPGAPAGVSAELMAGQPGFWGLDTSVQPSPLYFSVAFPGRPLTDVAAWLYATPDAVAQLRAANPDLPDWLPAGRTLRLGATPFSPAARQSLDAAQRDGTLMRGAGIPTGTEPQSRYYQIAVGGQLLTLTEAQYQATLQGLAVSLTRQARYLQGMARNGRETQAEHVAGTSSLIRGISDLVAGQNLPSDLTWDVPELGATRIIERLSAGPVTPELIERSARSLQIVARSLNHAYQTWHEYIERTIAGAQVSQVIIRDTAIILIATAAAAFAAPLVFAAAGGTAATAGTGTLLTAGSWAVGAGTLAGGTAAVGAEFTLPGARTEVPAGQRALGAFGTGAAVGGVTALGALLAPGVAGAISTRLYGVGVGALPGVGARMVVGGLTGVAVGAPSGAAEAGLLSLPQLARGELSGEEYLGRIGLGGLLGGLFGGAFGGLGGARAPRPATDLVPAPPRPPAPPPRPTVGGGAGPAPSPWRMTLLRDNPATGEMVVLGHNPQTGQTGILYINRVTRSGYITDLATGEVAPITAGRLGSRPFGLLPAGEPAPAAPAPAPPRAPPGLPAPVVPSAAVVSRYGSQLSRVLARPDMAVERALAADIVEQLERSLTLPQLHPDDVRRVLASMTSARDALQVRQYLSELRHANRVASEGLVAPGGRLRIGAEAGAEHELAPGVRTRIEPVSDADALYLGTDGRIHLDEVKHSAAALAIKILRRPRSGATQLENLVTWRRGDPTRRSVSLVAETDTGWTDLFGGRPVDAMTQIIDSGFPLRIGGVQFDTASLRRLYDAVAARFRVDVGPGRMTARQFFDRMPTLEDAARVLGITIP